MLLRLTGVVVLVAAAALLMRPAPTPASPIPARATAALATVAVAGTTASPAARGPIPDGYRIRVARLRIDLPIAEGVVERDIEQQRTPEGYAFHLPGTALPGERGNVYVYSHARVGMFLPLWEARIGDEIQITTPDSRTLTYVVTEVRPRVAPDDVSVVQPSPDERLTLQTSTGPSASDPRFVVIALPRP